MSSLQLTIEGMTCGHCAQSVTRELSQVAGITAVEVDQPAGLATVNATIVPSEAELAAAIAKAGYKLSSVQTV